ncbi:MAG: hypothetical protein K6E91_06125, partial [Butyrivibrio sp.]|nr:hypothetical protein [Butyrivibrio sp.]
MWINNLTLMVPEGGRVAINLALYIGEALILAYVFIGMRKLMDRRCEKRTEDSLFMWLCNVSLIRLILIVLVLVPDLFNNGMRRLVVPYGVVFALIQILQFLIPLLWLIFIDYFVNRSVARLKRKYKYAFIPFLILAVLYAAQYILLRMEMDAVRNYAMGGKKPFAFYLQDIYNIASFALSFCFILYAYLIVKTFHSEMKQPLFMRIDIFVVPWLIGTILTVITGFNVDSLFNSIAVLLIFISIKNRYRFLDSETQ